MYRIMSSSKDTYITNKVIDNSFTASDANVGKAGTLDLFKLYHESKLPGVTNVTELSRGLIKFDLNPLRKQMNTDLNISDSSFQCQIKLHDVYGGQTTIMNIKTKKVYEIKHEHKNKIYQYHILYYFCYNVKCQLSFC